jgi:hypothetical protein
VPKKLPALVFVADNLRDPRPHTHGRSPTVAGAS